MRICLELSQLIGSDEKATLKRVLNADDDSLPLALERVAMAAMEEYLEMVLGKQLPTRADEIRERRLFYLLKHYFTGRIPDELEVASLFQLTEGSSRSLLRNTLTKYRFDLETQTLDTIRMLLESAEEGNDTYHIVVRSEAILDEMKRVVSAKAPQLEQISKVRNSAGVYSFPKDTYELLCDHYGVDISKRQVAATE